MHTLNKTLENLRVSYLSAKLDTLDCHPDPCIQFTNWFNEALSAQVEEPNAFTLSTVSANRPRARILLLKGVYEDRFTFFTNYNSSKGSEIAANPNVSLTFLWLPLQRQVRIEGVAKKVDENISDDYFSKRPRGSQLGAIASPQSKKLESREVLEKMFEEVENKFLNIESLPRPKNWGGYEVEPNYIEFWQGRNNRMHDRICYEKLNGIWTMSRLAP
ncbi:MAG: pyridoxamine 5'-phosphate oxidase [Candidatus Babeliales bacterium]